MVGDTFKQCHENAKIQQGRTYLFALFYFHIISSRIALKRAMGICPGAVSLPASRLANVRKAPMARQATLLILPVSPIQKDTRGISRRAAI
jgi:hypothetical protein